MICYSIFIGGTPSKQRQEVEAPRTRRGLCVELLKEDIPLPMKWQAFLALGDNKADFAQAPADTTIVVSGGCSNEEDVLCSDPSLDVAVLRANQGKANTSFVLYAVSLLSCRQRNSFRSRHTSAVTSSGASR